MGLIPGVFLLLTFVSLIRNKYIIAGIWENARGDIRCITSNTGK
jgi:hypothetical protein